MVKGGPKSAARKCQPHLSGNNGGHGVARARQQSFEKHADWRKFERALLAKKREMGKLLSHSAEFPRRGSGIRLNLLEHFSCLGIFSESKQSLSAGRRIEPCTAYR